MEGGAENRKGIRAHAGFLVSRMLWVDLDWTSKPRQPAMASVYTGKVLAATLNPSQPWGPRPYHRPGCYYVRNTKTVVGHWVTYPNSTSAVRAGHPNPCKRCFR